VVTAAEMDRMTPLERAAAVDASVVRDWGQVPDAFRREVEATARRLSASLRAAQRSEPS
jgi:hypothetical protein